MMGTFSAPDFRAPARLEILDTESEIATGLAVAHYRRSHNPSRSDSPPWVQGLSSLPNEPAFIGNGSTAFSDHPFAAWLGAAVFLGAAEDLGAAEEKDSCAATAPLPKLASRGSAPPAEFARIVINYTSRGANGPG